MARVLVVRLPQNGRTNQDHVAGDLLYMIEQRYLLPGDRIPPFETLAKEYGYHISTVRRGLERLKNLDVLVVGARREGHRIAPRLDIQHLPPKLQVTLEAAHRIATGAGESNLKLPADT